MAGVPISRRAVLPSKAGRGAARPCAAARTRGPKLPDRGQGHARRAGVVQRAQAGGEGAKVFGPPPAMDAIEQALASMGHSTRLAAAAALLAGAAGTGAIAGGKLTERAKPIAQVVGATVIGGTAALGITKLQEKTYAAASSELHALCVASDPPESLSAEAVASLAPKYGMTSLSDKLEPEMKRLYDAYLSSILPSSDAPLQGDEPARLVAFKAALGIADAAAAECHIELGSRFSRQRLESGSKEGGLQELRGFQKLVFVSEQVFGEKKSKFLLPWKRVFNLTDAQLNLAKRDNARSLYEARLASVAAADLEAPFLASLRAFQLQLGLADAPAGDCMRAKCRKHAESLIDSAVESLNQRVRQRDLSKVTSALDSIVAFSDTLAALASAPDTAQGLGQVSLHGGKYGVDAQRTQLRDLFRVFLEERLAADGEISAATVHALDVLKLAFGMGTKEAGRVKHDVTAKVYRKLLAAAYRDGTLEASESKAAWLQQLCEKLDFEGEEALEINVEQFRLKLDGIIEKKKAISDEDDEELSKIQRLLCIQTPQVQEIYAEVKGKVFNETLRDVLTVSADAFGTPEIMRLRQSVNNLRLEPTLAVEMASGMAKKEMMGYVTRSRNVRNQVDAAQELKKLVFYNNFVLTPLVEEIDPAVAEDNKKRQEQAELMALMAKAKQEAQAEEGTSGEASEAGAEGEEAEVGEGGAALPSSLEKAKRGFADEVKGDSKVSRGQKEITLKDDMELRDRQDLYRTYLLYCLQGEVRKLGMGSSIVLERDEAEFARLIQLGEVLGLSDADTLQIHQSLAEQAFRNQAQQMVTGSSLTPDKEAKLKDLQGKLGLQDEAADKIIKGLVDQKVVGNLQALHAQGLLTVGKLRELKASGMDLDGVMKKEARESLFKKEVEQMLSDGQGNFDRQEVLVSMPQELGLEEKTAERFVEQSAKGRIRLLFVQAVSFLRQRKVADMVSTLNNVISCHQALPSESVSWNEREELLDAYAYYYSKAKGDTAKLASLRQVLGLPEAEAASVEKLVDEGKFALDEQIEDDNVAIF